MGKGKLSLEYKQHMTKLLKLARDSFKKYLYLQLLSTRFRFYHQMFLFLNKIFKLRSCKQTNKTKCKQETSIASPYDDASIIYISYQQDLKSFPGLINGVQKAQE